MDKKFIDADMLISELDAACMPIFEKGISGDLGDENSIADIINAQPAADVQEVRHGKWKGYTRSAFHGMDDFGDPIYRNVNIWECSECCRKSVIKENYCPRCGARNEGEENG